MPIDELSPTEVVQRCAMCGATRQVPMDSLSLGVGSHLPGDVDGRVLRMPPCANCKAEEFLVRHDEEVAEHLAGTELHRHRLLVGQLHAQLALSGRVDSRLIGMKAQPLSGSLRERYFATGLRLREK